MKQFYEINTVSSNKYVEIESIYEECYEIRYCDKCHAVDTELKFPLRVKLRNSKKMFGDFILCCAEPITIISQNVLDFLIAKKIGFKSQKIILFDEYNQKIKNIPNYYMITADKKFTLDFEKMNVVANVCSKCRKINFSKDIWEISKTYLMEEDRINLIKMFTIEYYEKLLYVNHEFLLELQSQKFSNYGVRMGIDKFNIINGKIYKGKEIDKMLKA